MAFRAAVTWVPIAGQLAGGGMLVWEIYSAGKTIGHIMANQDAIFDQVKAIFHDPDLRMWFDCIPQADCEELSFQMGEVLGSALVNRKDLKSNILQARTKVKDFVRKLFKGGGKKKALSRLNDSDTVKPATESNLDPTDVGPGGAANSVPLAGSIRTVNPNFPAAGFNQNCVNCVIATEQRFAGVAGAIAQSSAGPLPISNIVGEFGGSFQNVSGMMEIGSILSKSGNGARGIVFGADNARGFGHVWNVRIDNGVVRFLDSQPAGHAGLGVDNFDDFTDFQFLLTSHGR